MPDRKSNPLADLGVSDVVETANPLLGVEAEEVVSDQAATDPSVDRFSLERSFARAVGGAAIREVGDTMRFFTGAGAISPGLLDPIPGVRSLRRRAAAPIVRAGTRLAESGQAQIEEAVAKGPPEGEAAIRGLSTVASFADVAVPSGAALGAAKLVGRGIRKIPAASKLDEALDAARNATFAKPPVQKAVGIVESAVDGLRKLQADWINSLAGFERVGRQLGKKSPSKAKEFEVIAQWNRAATTMGASPVSFGTRHLGTGEKTGEPLKDILTDIGNRAAEIGEDADRLQGNLALKVVHERRVSLAEQTAAKTRKRPVDVDAKTVAESRRTLAMLNAKYGDKLDDLAQRYRDWSYKANVEPLIEAEVISAREAERIRDLGGDYAFFKTALEHEFGRRGAQVGRAMDQAVPIKGKFAKRAGEKIEDLWQAEADRSYRVWIFANQQKARNLLAEAADLSEDTAKEVRKVPFRESGGDLQKKQSQPRKLTQGRRGANQFVAYRNGQRVLYEAEPDILRALDYLRPHEVHGALKFAKSATDLFRSGTTLTLGFITRNPLRDLLTAGVYTRNGQIPFLSAANWMGRELAHRLRYGKASEMWEEFLASPGPHATLIRMDRGTVAEELVAVREIAKTRGRSLRGQGLKRFRRGDLVYPLKALSSALEKPGRFTEFALARKAGKSIGEAGLDASEVTLNFLRAGRYGREWNMIEAFSNAMLQDPSRFARAVREKPIAAGLQAFTYLTLPAIISYARNRQNPDWHALPEHEKVLFLHPVGQRGEAASQTERTGERFTRMPMPPGVLSLLFSYLPQQLLLWADGKQGGGDAVANFLGEFVGETPLRFIPGVGAIGEDRTFVDPFIELTPNLGQPVIELAAKRIPFFGGRPPVPGRLERLSPSEQRTERTTAPANAIAGVLNRGRGAIETGLQSLGADPTQTGIIPEVSPAAVDHLIRGYVGGLGRDIARSLSPQQPAEFRFPDVPERLRGVPVVRELISALTSSSPIGFGSQPVRRFYNAETRLDQAASTWKQQSTKERKAAWLQERPEAKYAKEFRKVREELGDLAEERRQAIEAQDQDRMIQTDMLVTLRAIEAMEWLEAQLKRDLKGERE